ncbi:hypothetical protein AB0M46_33845 [Dactylosporangium sp. NPDC051485]|uniref:hypothetical protein n=1 Tax=Dactylosporangium sp. NPDC051485 TaxID=3154846 RepID=UPI003445E0F0
MGGRGPWAWLERYAARRDGVGGVLVSWMFMVAAVFAAVLAVALRSPVLGYVAAVLVIALCWRRYFRGHW